MLKDYLLQALQVPNSGGGIILFIWGILEFCQVVLYFSLPFIIFKISDKLDKIIELLQMQKSSKPGVSQQEQERNEH